MAYSGTRGSRMADFRCLCGGGLRGKSAHGKSAGKKFDVCVVCKARREIGGWRAFRLEHPWRVLSAGRADLMDELRDVARRKAGDIEYPGPVGAFVCRHHGVEIPPADGRAIFEAVCAEMGAVAPSDEELRKLAHSFNGARRDAAAGDRSGCRRSVKLFLEWHPEFRAQAACVRCQASFAALDMVWMGSAAYCAGCAPPKEAA